MSKPDLVERLRAYQRERDQHELILEAADEIERLRERLNTLCADALWVDTRAEVEIERLRAEAFSLAATQCHDGYGREGGGHRCRYQDEIERLREEAKRNFLREQDIIDAAAENERLRAGLRELVEAEIERARVGLLEIAEGLREIAEIHHAKLNSCDACGGYFPCLTAEIVRRLLGEEK